MIPMDTIGQLLSYRDEHIPLGSFGQALMENDLIGAFQNADAKNLAAMFDTVQWIYNEMPINCYGSKEAYKEWIHVTMEA